VRIHCKDNRYDNDGTSSDKNNNKHTSCQINTMSKYDGQNCSMTIYKIEN